MKQKTTNILRLTNMVRQNIQREKLFHSWHNLLITVSGGQDSAFCLLVLYLLNENQQKSLSSKWSKEIRFTLNYKKLLNLINQYKVQSSLVENKYTPQLCLNNYENNNPSYLSKILFLQKGSQIYDSLVGKQTKAKGNKALLCFACTNFYLTLTFLNNYTLLWCNHLWQKDSFFAMEHVSKLAFSKKYKTHFFAPVKKVLSEQKARRWRHKVIQRSSLFIGQAKRRYELRQSNTLPKQGGGDQAMTNYSLHKKTLADTSSCTRAKAELLQKLCYVHMPPLLGTIFGLALLSVNSKKITNLGKHQPKKTVSRFEDTSPQRAHALLKLQPGQFMSLFLSSVPIATPFLFTSTKKSICDSKKHIDRNEILHNRVRTQTSFIRTTPALLVQEESCPNPILNSRYRLPALLCVQGHTKSDRAEAILFNVIRGAGISGLSTLQWKQTFDYHNQQENNKFYPVLSDFLKEIPIIYLDIFLLKKKETTIQKLNKQRPYIKFASTSTQLDTEQHKVLLQPKLCYEQANFRETESQNYNSKSRVQIKTFYYQLKYKKIVHSP